MSYTAERTAEINEAADAISNLTVGDGVTVSVWTDCDAYTIIRKTPKTITLQMDKATLSPDWKPEFIVGGFAGHCVNQADQRYTYERDENEHTIKITLRSWLDDEGSERRRWKRSGTGTNSQGGSAYAGRRKFHDYNF